MEAAGVEPEKGQKHKVLKNMVNSVQTLINTKIADFYVFIPFTTILYHLSLILITKAITVNYA